MEDKVLPDIREAESLSKKLRLERQVRSSKMSLIINL